MSIRINFTLWQRGFGNMLRIPKSNPFPDVIGTFMGRDALSLAASFLDLSPSDKILLPAYLCREVVKPFLGKTHVKFYDLRSDLAVDPEEIKMKFAEERPKMMMIINYFGFLQPYREEIKRVCADNGVILIEDCAHSLLTEGSGGIGDLSIYSFRKTLPLPDGGGLKINMKGQEVTPDFYPRIYSNVLSMLILFKSLFNFRTEVFSRAGITSRAKNLAPKASLAKQNSRVLPLSLFACNGMGNTSFAEIIERKRNDFQFWKELAERISLFTPVFSNLPSGVCPLGFPVKVKDRDLLKLRLQEEGIYLKIYWDLPADVGREFVRSHKLSKQICTLPVYPEVSLREREKIAKLLTADSI